MPRHGAHGRSLRIDDSSYLPAVHYQPYQNRECLHCHEGARSFEELSYHAEMRPKLLSNETSCLECHADVHAVRDLEEKSFWTDAAGR